MDKSSQSSQKLVNQIFNVVIDVLKKWQIILFVTVTFGLVYDTVISLQYQPLYQCQATFAIKTSSTAADTDGDVGETFTYIFRSNVFKKKIQESMEVKNLNGYYTATSNGANILYVSAVSPSVKTSYSMMESLIEHYKDVSSLVLGNTNIELVEDINAPTYPYNTINHKRNILLLSAVGFILTTGILACLSFLKNTIKDKYEIESKLHLHLLGTLPIETKVTSLKGLKRKKAILVNQYSTSFQYIESVKRIRSRLERHVSKHDGHNVFMVTSSLENEGKSSVAVNLALSLAENNHKVILVDGDLRKPSIHLILEQKEGIGIEKVMHEKNTLEESIIHYNDTLDLILGFNSEERTTDMIQDDITKDIIGKLKEMYDYVIIDSAPSRFLSDSSLLASYCDGIILVVRQNHAKVSTILNTIDKLTLSNTPIIGCINNRCISNFLQKGKYYGYRYGYNHYYGKRHTKKKGE